MSYRNLCTQFYDLSKPCACSEEVNFYADQIVEGPILEAMCGSGRLLLPLLKRGYQIEGMDNSPEMLESCQKRVAAEHLSTPLYLQSLEEMSLKKYALIFIAVGSFQLIMQPLEILRILRSHLLPGGSLILDTFMPTIEEEVQERFVDCPDGSKIYLTTKTTLYPKEQLEVSQNHYRKCIGTKVIAEEKEELKVRWYKPLELEQFLEKAGFTHIETSHQAFEHNPDSLVYISNANDKP